MSVLVLAEHDNSVLKDATLPAITAATQLGGDVHVLVAGKGAQAVADAAAKVAGVSKVLLADDAAYENALAENLAPLVVGLMANYDAFVAPATSRGKNLAPRVAAALDVAQISEILSVESTDTFTRPIYAGNAIATVKSSDTKKLITVRVHGVRSKFRAERRQRPRLKRLPSPAPAMLDSSQFKVSQEVAAKLERPELTAAKIIVSGGRALGSCEKDSTRLSRRWLTQLGAGDRCQPRGGRCRATCRTIIRSARPARIVAPATLYRDRDFRRDPASGRHEGLQDHRRHQQGRRRADLPGRGHRPRRRPVHAGS